VSPLSQYILSRRRVWGFDRRVSELLPKRARIVLFEGGSVNRRVLTTPARSIRGPIGRYQRDTP
jgi:hypothetical protein